MYLRATLKAKRFGNDLVVNAVQKQVLMVVFY